MEDAIEKAEAAMELALLKAKNDLNKELTRAKDAFYAFIDDRLGHWAEKYEYETINAKWQEDSYYRYNLLKLLQAKQKAIDEAVAEAKIAF